MLFAAIFIRVPRNSRAPVGVPCRRTRPGTACRSAMINRGLALSLQRPHIFITINAERRARRGRPAEALPGGHTHAASAHIPRTAILITSGRSIFRPVYRRKEALGGGEIAALAAPNASPPIHSANLCTSSPQDARRRRRALHCAAAGKGAWPVKWVERRGDVKNQTESSPDTKKNIFIF